MSGSMFSNMYWVIAYLLQVNFDFFLDITPATNLFFFFFLLVYINLCRVEDLIRGV